MANKPSGLGKGLGALLGDSFLDTQEEKESLFLPISQVESCSGQPRKQFDPESLADLADSIREHGIIQPLTVRKLQSGYYQIIAGERRWRAARMAGLSEVPCIVIEADDRKAMELALIENLQREDLNPIEEAMGYQTLVSRYGLTQEQTAAKVGKSQSSVANKLRLLRFTDEQVAFIRRTGLSERHARCVLRLPAARYREALEHIARENLTVAQTESYVEGILSPLAPALKKPAGPRPKGLVRDARIFLNTINRAFEVMQESGLRASCDREEREDAVILHIRIPK